ncbi:MAG: hypothetical protein LBQ65_08610 [Tannerellaceae bacterium]|jgi:hypothetical protein|nr:hypothetical protein [Tannerellaceae bacterium]
MKKLSFVGLLSVCTLLLTSCLEGGSNEQSRSGVPGIVRLDMKLMKMVIDAPDFYPFAFYASNMPTDANDGDCILFGYSVNYSDAINANYQTTGLIEGNLTAFSLLDQYPVQPAFIDTTQLLEKEQPIAYSVAANGGWLYLSGKLFLASEFKQKTEQKTNWLLYYHPDLPTQEIEGKKVYSLFLRATLQAEGKTPEISGSVINAFDAKRFFDAISNMEKSQGNKEAYFQINHISEIKEDSTFSWKQPEVLTLTISNE